MAKKIKATKSPTRATFNSEQFNTLIRMVQTVTIKQMEFQQALNQIIAKRDAYYAQIATQYHLPATFNTMRWDDETLQIEIT